MQPITSSIIQGSGIGTSLWTTVYAKSDLHPLSHVNVMLKHADDITLLVPKITDVSLAVEFLHVETLADSNGLIINTGKTKELVLRRSHPNKHKLSQCLEGIKQVQTARLLGVIFQSSFSFISQANAILKLYS